MSFGVVFQMPSITSIYLNQISSSTIFSCGKEDPSKKCSRFLLFYTQINNELPTNEILDNYSSVGHLVSDELICVLLQIYCII